MIGIAEIFLIIAGTAFLLQLIYYFVFYLRLAFRKESAPVTHAELPPVSVIICARSESALLVENLPNIFSQDYPEFEVVVVNDRSWDDTEDILKAFGIMNSNLHAIHIAESSHEYYGKKMALTLGIKGAKHDIVVLTDADCRPSGNQWLKEIVSRMKPQDEIVLGYSPYQKRKGFLNKLIRFDTLLGGVNYLSFAHAGIPYMGVGRNLCYRKDVFFRVSGFKKHYHIASGDDDLLINETATKKNTKIVMTPASQVISIPKEDFTSWRRQKKRHFTTAPFYKLKHKLLLSLWPASFWILLIATAGMIFLNKYLLIILIAWIIRLLLQLVIFNRLMKSLGDQDLLVWVPLLELILFILHPIIYLSNRFVKADKWN
jgi:cellulose synthase/poly-beta-1,6-N-acetylglucosamine synthase-like glycosyltransferase